MSDFGLRLTSNEFCHDKRGQHVAYTYLWAGRRNIRVPVPVLLGRSLPDLADLSASIPKIQKALPEEDRQRILAVSFVRLCERHKVQRLERLGGLAVATRNRFTLPVMNPKSSAINEFGVGVLEQRDPESTPQSPKAFRGGAPLAPAIVLPVYDAPFARVPVTDAVAAAEHTFVALHGDLEQVVDESVLAQAA